ncbi:TrbG/VirB9 family P-type conjugative transfer protein [Novosphingobium album (ex Liu et al. 2023)]|uniref:TrbG/VirB9 family P-type conjugative transfer protein n=1 Tax=Novosphingobium album (ex Liu et al. 2023) TaxID=3031130 RepID=A0ABT5WMI7_9SPHN|nr:TrbG/VirB9 family P-type conjugative transfer protein [Novosphingobium album (ex Liu et al. 2023)]MDE8650143.1 TrbG/VirB9 family P-type conjugative transfer protein [Novosphingobium album (ex Liu et al. 2023)]
MNRGKFPAARIPAVTISAATVLAGAALLALAGPVHADERLTERLYSENEVVRIDGKLGVQATIAFDENESIENVAVGDSQTWQITPNKRANLLFVKPLEAGARTNMTVVTDKHTYFFDLIASAKARPLYMLRFTYPKEKTPPAELAGLTAAEQAALTADAGQAPVDPAMLNFAWKRDGDSRIQPSRIYDDGNATYLLWADKQAVPAILVRNEKGDEGPINYAVRGNTIVIDDVPRTILLRAGKARAMLENTRPEPAAAPITTPDAAPAPEPPGPAPTTPADPAATTGVAAASQPVAPALKED